MTKIQISRDFSKDFCDFWDFFSWYQLRTTLYWKCCQGQTYVWGFRTICRNFETSKIYFALRLTLLTGVLPQGKRFRKWLFQKIIESCIEGPLAKKIFSQDDHKIIFFSRFSIWLIHFTSIQYTENVLTVLTFCCSGYVLSFQYLKGEFFPNYPFINSSD